MKLLFKGAEGDLYSTVWNGKKAIVKIRKTKKYRNFELDSRIRHQRVIREAQILSFVKSFGIHTPLVYLVELKKYSITMQQISGTKLYDLPDKTLIKCCSQVGRIVGILHKNSITHGDLTTSNFILSDGVIFTIDFGLANKTIRSIDHAVDLRLFKEILTSAHTRIMQKAWKKFLSGYSSQYDEIDRVLSHLSNIESRGRYATVV